MITGRRQAHRDLAVVLFAKLPAALPRHADRVRALLRDCGVADDQRADRAALLHHRQDAGAYCRQHRLVRPIGLCHQVMQRVMRRPHEPGVHPGGHRLDALAITRQQ